ncbi:unnamed protein product, partial [Mesorhabditis belari]|uniref:Uncharacterized protein n=1 Tax=Mesorhabditis belari TaxID=2138241 RepID=A0AAF3J2K9_9BILA
MDGHRPPTTLAQKGRSSSQGGGPNVLLKQAIANRIGKDETMNHDAQVQQLDRSLLTHPAWSRDQDGRTGEKLEDIDLKGARKLSPRRSVLTRENSEPSLRKKKKPPMPMYRISGVETDSLASFYPEDVQPDRFLIGEDEYEYVSLEQLPDTVREAVIRDMNEGNFYEEMGSHDEGSGINLGSMSRLHEVPESNDEMPRSASGYFDESGLHDSYQQAMQNSQKQKPSENLFQSFYENVQGGYVGTSSQDRYPSPGMINSNILNEIRADPTYPTSPIRELSLKEQRQAFFRSMLPNERSTSGPTSPTSPEETEMRKQFVQRYGRRKAPIAEGDPADPRPSLGASQDSVVSLGSHESVVSAASIRAERAVRRDFNY